MPSSFETECRAAHDLLSSCEGYFLENASLNVNGDLDELNLTLHERPYRPDIVVNLTRIYCFAMSKPPEASGSFVDECRVTYIPQNASSWPTEIDGRLGPRHGGLPDLVWVRVTGPFTVDVVAATITVFVAKVG
ncbi:hypothetical protein [Microbispora bryophytorum]|uniref:Uncharacterized protein n=1 Tax=Microbispora bryophytorum subsp. camponoti TaxID=1677852 RepID=A0ABR8L2A5_9ACTN|nr:hypothetical protein [Microbispora camponoti]MBD3142603.1 hypothetical protein [Microbispora camponoti]